MLGAESGDAAVDVARRRVDVKPLLWGRHARQPRSTIRVLEEVTIALIPT